MGAWVYTYKRVPLIAVVAIAALVLVLWDRPTGKVIIGLTLIVLVVMTFIEFFGRPRSPVAAAETSPAVSETPEAKDREGSNTMPGSVNPSHNPAEAHKLTTQRKPMCVVEVSSDWGDRAAGR